MILDRSYGLPAEWEGLGYESAEACTPKWYGVSSGNGNDGVSHMYPAYFVRTCDPYRLAELAMVSRFKPDFYAAAIEAVEVDGEADYTIYATIYNPEDVDPSEAPDPVYFNSYECDECDHAWTHETEDSEEECECPKCDHLQVPHESEEQERDGDDTYSSANGAWQIIEVFPVDQDARDNSSRMEYDSLEEAFSADVRAIVESEL
jgi:hypothetical protein